MNNLDKNDTLNFLQEHSGMVLSTLSADKQLESAYVFYAVNDQLELFILTNKSTQKYINIQTNKEITFVVTDEKKFITLQGKGNISAIDNDDERIIAFDAVMKVMVKKVKNWPPPTGKFKDINIAILKIKPTWWRLSDYGDSKNFLPEDKD